MDYYQRCLAIPYQSRRALLFHIGRIAQPEEVTDLNPVKSRFEPEYGYEMKIIDKLRITVLYPQVREYWKFSQFTELPFVAFSDEHRWYFQKFVDQLAAFEIR